MPPHDLWQAGAHRDRGFDIGLLARRQHDRAYQPGHAGNFGNRDGDQHGHHGGARQRHNSNRKQDARDRHQPIHDPHHHGIDPLEESGHEADHEPDADRDDRGTEPDHEREPDIFQEQQDEQQRQQSADHDLLPQVVEGVRDANAHGGDHDRLGALGDSVLDLGDLAGRVVVGLARVGRELDFLVVLRILLGPGDHGIPETARGLGEKSDLDLLVGGAAATPRRRCACERGDEHRARSEHNQCSQSSRHVCCPSLLLGLPHVACVQLGKLQTVVLPRAPTIQDTSCSWLSAVAGASPILRPRRITIARSATAITWSIE